jgi:hypothetical protein
MLVVPSQEQGYPYVSDKVVVHPFPGIGSRITVSMGEPRLRASRRPSIGLSPSTSRAACRGALGGTRGEQDAGARTVERRRRVSRSMAGEEAPMFQEGVVGPSVPVLGCRIVA